MIQEYESGQNNKRYNSALYHKVRMKNAFRFLNPVFYILLSIFLNYHLMFTTMFYREHLYVYVEVINSTYNYATICLIYLSIITLFTVANGPKYKFATLITIMTVFLYNYYREITTLRSVMVFFLLAICSQGKSLKVICRLFLVFGWGWLIASFIGYKIGYLSDVVSDGKRHAFGSVYCTDLACRMLTMSMALCILKKGKLRIFDYAVMIGLMVVNILFIKGKVGFICLFLLFCVTFFYQFIYPKTHFNMKKCRLLSLLFICAYAVFAAITIAMTLKYTESPDLIINKFHFLGTFTSRFRLGNRAFREYPVNLWGNVIVEKGNGGIVDGAPVVDYFFLDISYVRILLLNGVMIFVLMLAYFSALQIKLYKRRNMYFMTIVFIFLLDCAVEHHILELAQDFMPFLLFADVNSLDDNSFTKSIQAF